MLLYLLVRLVRPGHVLPLEWSWIVDPEEVALETAATLIGPRHHNRGPLANTLAEGPDRRIPVVALLVNHRRRALRHVSEHK